jgi:CRISPR-associated protein Csx17
MAKIVLGGCLSTPLSGYLKALGVLRLLAEQSRDRRVRARWENDVFTLDTSLTRDDISWFFLHQYQPTPLIAPWNGSTGFYAKDKAQQKLLESITAAGSVRLKIYGETIACGQRAVDHLKLEAQPKDKTEKQQLLMRLRNTLPDEAVKWLDTCALISSDDLKFPPLTGTGGNDGNFEFSRTFMQQLQELFDFKIGEPTPPSEKLIQSALFGDIVPGLEFKGKIGQFNPIAAGGVNALPGYGADSRVNPWDYVLMLEGLLLFTSAATRRYESSNDGSLAYPFMVRPAMVGYGSAADGDSARAELWAPLWSQPVGVRELQVLFNEGRAKLGSRTVRDGVDFVRAIASQGVARGIDEFVRYSFMERNGLSYFAVSLGRVAVRSNAAVDRLVAIDGWRDRFRRAAQDANAPNSIKSAARRLETALYEFSLGKAGLLAVLIALGEAEKALGRSLKFTIEKGLRPLWISDFSEASAWIDDCNDDSPEFRLALALAGAGLRPRLVQVRQSGNAWPEWVKDDDGKTIWSPGSLIDNLLAWVRREEIEAARVGSKGRSDESSDNDEIDNGNLTNKPFAGLADIEYWVAGQIDETRLEAIARGLCLLRPKRVEIPHEFGAIPADYALLKLVHHRHLNASQVTSVFKRAVIGSDVTIPQVPNLLTVLARGDGQQATALAIARLRASQLDPALTTGLAVSPERSRRLGAALAFPLGAWAIARLFRQIRILDDRSDRSRESREA